MFCSVCKSCSDGNSEAGRDPARVEDRVGDESPQTKAHPGEEQRLQTEAKGAPASLRKRASGSPPANGEKNKHIFRDMPTGPMTHPSWKVTPFSQCFFVLTSATLSFGGGD